MTCVRPETLQHLTARQLCFRTFEQEPGIRAGTVCRNSGRLCLRGTVATRDIQVQTWEVQMVESQSALCYCRTACQKCAGTGKSGPDGTYAGFAAQAGDVIARVPRKYTVELPNV